MIVGFFAFSHLGRMATASNKLNSLCLKRLNFKTALADIYKALVCGKRLPNNSVKELFIQGGLIHLTVISGAHLLFLEKFWKKLPLPSVLKTPGLFIVLVLYALVSGMHPPVVRALFSFFLFRLSHSLKLFWQSHFITLISAVLCLIYKPSWVHSFSLQLSLLACLLQDISKNSMKKHFFVYLFILPIVNRWQALHPLTVLINWIAAPLISSLLFPLSFLSPFFPGFYKFTDSLWILVLKALKGVELLPSQSPLMNWFVPKNWIWFYIGLLCLFLFAVRFLQRRLKLYPRYKT